MENMRELSAEELDSVVDAMAGWQRGHPPYQL